MQKEAIFNLAKEKGILRPKDLIQLGLAPHNLNEMSTRGQLSRIGRGLYTLPNHEWSENHSLAEVAKAVPTSVVCLLSALRFHEIGTQSPFEVWIAIPRDKAGVPKSRGVQIRTVKISGRAYEEGAETHNIEGTDVRVYSIAKTVTDCWKFRNQIGMDVALEALREVIQFRKVNMDELRRFAQTNRVWNVMQPYVEAIV